MAELTLQESGPEITRVALCGRLDITGTQDVETKFTATVCPAGLPALVDVSAVTYVSSMGIQMLIQVAKALGRHNARLALCCPTAEVKAALIAAGLNTLLFIADSETEALNALQSA